MRLLCTASQIPMAARLLAHESFLDQISSVHSTGKERKIKIRHSTRRPPFFNHCFARVYQTVGPEYMESVFYAKFTGELPLSFPSLSLRLRYSVSDSVMHR
jgi:hypothetical protein